MREGPRVIGAGGRSFPLALVRVPATSANVGVGFDCLGLALDLTATFLFAPADELAIDGCEERFRSKDNLVWQSYLYACGELGLAPQPLHVTILSPIPLAGGLGSSSACALAGIGAAMALGPGFDRDRALELAVRLEGHPDNVAPALLGGLVCSFTDERDHTTATRMEVAPNLRFVAVTPPYEVRTADARRVLPQEVSRDVAVWQMGRIVAVVRALETGDAGLLAAACHDRLHEPYRARLIPDHDELRDVALQAGACAFMISGSGSTMLAVADGDERAARVAAALTEARPGFWLRTLPANTLGTTVELH